MPVNASTGGSDEKAADASATRPWTTNARLTLTFDQELQVATASRQEGVRFYYWMAIPAAAVNFETRQVTGAPGYVLVFLSLNDPTNTNYSQAKVIGGGILCEMLASHPAGAAVRVMGDMRGRTVDIRFSDKPIPLD